VLGSAIEQWFSFASTRHTWVSVQGQTVRGVVSARKRATRLAWEIDTLIAADEDVTGVGIGLFDQVVAGAARAGAQKLYLRVEAGSDLLAAAHRAGFVSYARETLLQLYDAHPTDAPPPEIAIRPRTKGDAYALFQLYNKSAPAEVRRIEAATFQEWLAALEERARGRGRLDLIGEHESRAVAWVRAGREADLGRIDLLVHPECWPQTDALLAAALSGLRRDHPVFCLVRDYAAPVQLHLESNGFVRAGEFVSLAKRLVQPARILAPRRVPVPALVQPLIAKPKPLAPAITKRDG